MRIFLLLSVMINFIIGGEVPVFDRCLVGALKMILADNNEAAMNEIRIGINVYWHEKRRDDLDIEKEYEKHFVEEKDKNRKSSLAIGMAAFSFIKRDGVQCRKWLMEAVLNDPKKPEVYNMRGATLYWEHRHDEAIVQYTKAIQLKRNYLDAISNRGNAYSEIGDIPKAVADRETYQRIIQNTGSL